MSFEPRCKACRDNDKTLFYVFCSGCAMRREYVNRAKAEPIVCPEVNREVFPTSFPPTEQS